MIRVFTNEEIFSSVSVREASHLEDKVTLNGLGEAFYTKNHIQNVLQKAGLPFSTGVEVAVFPAATTVGSYNRYDLAIALALISAKAGLDVKDDILILGELDDYKVSFRSSPSFSADFLSKALSSAFKFNITSAIIPKRFEAAVKVPEGMTVFFASSIHTAIVALQNFARGKLKDLVGKNELSDSGITFPDVSEYVLPLENISDDEQYATQNMKFASVVAAAGGLNLMLFGEPGCKKTMVAHSMSTFLPKLSRAESIEVRRIYASAGLNNGVGSINKGIRPFRMPHQTASIEGICGGGPNCRPGEISLAHKGVLFLDEAAEFRSSVLQMLRVPLETKSITLSRGGRTVRHPADFQLVAALNPCPCGNYGSKTRICLCSRKSVEQYWAKFSAPLLDKMDIKVFAGGENFSPEKALTTARARQLVKNAWEARAKRLNTSDINPLTPEAQKAIEDAAMRYNWSSRAKASVTRIAGVLSDMYQKENVTGDMVELAVKLHGFSSLMPEL